MSSRTCHLAAWQLLTGATMPPSLLSCTSHLAVCQQRNLPRRKSRRALVLSRCLESILRVLACSTCPQVINGSGWRNLDIFPPVSETVVHSRIGHKAERFNSSLSGAICWPGQFPASSVYLTAECVSCLLKPPSPPSFLALVAHAVHGFAGCSNLRVQNVSRSAPWLTLPPLPPSLNSRPPPLQGCSSASPSVIP